MKTMTITGQGYTNAAESLDFKPYPVTATITGTSRDNARAVINGIDYPALNVRAKVNRDNHDEVVITIDTGRGEAMITMASAEWIAAAQSFNG